MQLYKCLAPNRKSPFQTHQYPPAGEWASEIDGEPLPCQHGYHLLRPRDLPRWLEPELWRVEVLSSASIIKHHDCVVTTSPVRLVERVEAWCPATMAKFAGDCAGRVKAITANCRDASLAAEYADSTTDHANVYATCPSAIYAAETARFASYAATHAALAVHSEASSAVQTYDAERLWQARRLCEILNLNWKE